MEKLEKLFKIFSITSNEAIENPENINEIKKYIHVERKIERDFLNLIKEGDGKKLILLVGNVGDGKSHLIGIMKKKYPDIFKQYTYINDATESSAPDKTVMETLSQKLKNFSDDYLETKEATGIILAINTGVLNAFKSDEKLENFQKFKEFIERTCVLQEKQSIKNIEDDNFSIISFMEYKLYEINEEKKDLDSEFLRGILRKITHETRDNIFYKTYLELREREPTNYLVNNFEVLMNKVFVDKLIYLIIKMCLEKKINLSVRKLFDFIYEMIISKNQKSIYDNIFEKKESNSYIYELEEYDPCKITSEQIDQEIEKMGDSEGIKTLLREKYFLTNSLDDDLDYKEFKKKVIQTKLSDKLNDDDLQDFLDDFKKIIIHWYGTLEDEEYIVMKKTKKYQMLFNTGDLEFELESGKNNSLKIKYCDDEDIFLEIDFQLYKLIQKHKKGYIIKNCDRENSMNLERFIEEIIEYILKNKNNKKYLYQSESCKLSVVKSKNMIRIFEK